MMPSQTNKEFMHAITVDQLVKTFETKVKKAGLKGKILRPLSAKLLNESECEKKGLVDRDKLLSIRGRRRLPQITLAKILGINEYPNPSGGCLLTDPRFAQRIRDHLKYGKELTMQNVELLKLGRHFRLSGFKIIVGRNEDENNMLKQASDNHGIPYIEVEDYMGPVTLYFGKEDISIIKKAASITVRYSDAPKDVKIRAIYSNGKKQIIESKAEKETEYALPI